jgi:exonuclease VII large subunit
MKNNIFAFAVIGFMAGTLSAGCGKTSEQKVEIVKENARDAEHAWKDAQTEYSSDWQTFLRESDQAIDANEKRIDAFKEGMEKAGSKVSAKYSRNVAALEQKNRDMKKKLKEYKDEGPIKWEEFKTNFKHDMDGMEKTMTDLFKDNA